MQKPDAVLSVSEINRYVKGLIQGDPRLRDLWVAGEISNFKHHRSGHMYFRIKDSTSSLRCVFFRRENQRCLFEPTDGMEVIINGSISVYEPDGAYQLYVADLEPAGKGSFFLAYEQLKEKLGKEGLFRDELKQKIPFLPRKIALVTSPSGAALQDILTTVKKRFPHVHLLVVESLVQGPGAAPDIVRALEMLNRRDDIDLIILTRGGGSIEDLWPFNDEAVARAVHCSILPVITAVGHETDFTIADFVADMRAATPTAAAVAALPDRGELLDSLTRLDQRLAQGVQRRVIREKQYLDHVVGERFYRRPRERVKASCDHLAQLSDKLGREMVRQLQLKGMKLSGLIDRLESYSPLKVMNRGYSFCRDEQGNIVRSVKDIRLNQLLKLNFKDGRADCRTERIEEDGIIEGQEKG